ncbi:MAG: hypothetical protein WEB56_06035 [Roseovarius sp.]
MAADTCQTPQIQTNVDVVIIVAAGLGRARKLMKSGLSVQVVEAARRRDTARCAAVAIPCGRHQDGRKL